MANEAVIICVCLAFALCVSTVNAGECCKAYTDLTFQKHPAQWCSDYCCGISGALYCCDSILLQASEDLRDNFCVQWWAQHLYVPILVAVFVLLIALLTCCCCCGCCSCCRRSSPGYIVSNGGGQSSVVMVSQQQQQQQQSVMPGRQDPFHVGYDQ